MRACVRACGSIRGAASPLFFPLLFLLLDAQPFLILFFLRFFLHALCLREGAKFKEAEHDVMQASKRLEEGGVVCLHCCLVS